MRSYDCTRQITLKNIVNAAYDPATETLKIDVPVTPITNDDAMVLERLFPHQQAQVDQLFAVEMLISCFKQKED